jgi:hypothetical protein
MRRYDLGKKVEHGANACAVLQIGVDGLPDDTRLGRRFRIEAREIRVRVGNGSR